MTLMYHIKTVFAGLEVFNYKVVSNLRDKIPTDLAVFNMRNTSPVRCVQRCALNKNCLSVSLTSNSICQGYSKVYGINSSSLITHTGTRLYAWRITEESSCNVFGYTWNASLSVCYKIHTGSNVYQTAVSQCSSEHPRSRLLLVDSESIYNFLLDLIETHNLGAVYLQGTRTPGSAYVDDEGRPIPFFRWDVGEPEPTGDYLRTDDVSRLQEVSTGVNAYNYICSIYNYF
ncbi:uncharacterized protein LOC128158428 [Crassostrea angulata]|uniref:uncharacterized protein LOC128158428 n=1 Tax=Magallana angulata TaxID=2784310 RepID=UPI0022B10DF1|nr:uncharacterized protein LOC128158428 [Crassostrea angulata]